MIERCKSGFDSPKSCTKGPKVVELRYKDHYNICNRL
jgi:hypothetical protein